MPILLIDNYDSFTYNLYQMTQALTTESVNVFRNDAIDFSDILELKPSAVILSPGPGHPAVPADFGICSRIILEQKDLNCQVLGVCLGHQGIVHYMGGKVVQAEEIVHGKTSFINVTKQSPLFEGLSNPFQAMRYHSLIASEDDFPAELEVSAREVNRGLIMAVQNIKKRLYGIQFHPESIGTPEGSLILRNFLEKC